MSSQRKCKAERRRVRSIIDENIMLKEFRELVFDKPPVWKFRAWLTWRKKVWG